MLYPKKPYGYPGSPTSVTPTYSPSGNSKVAPISAKVTMTAATKRTKVSFFSHTSMLKQCSVKNALMFNSIARMPPP